MAIPIERPELGFGHLEKPTGVYMECPGNKGSPDKGCRSCQYIKERTSIAPESKYLSKGHDKRPDTILILTCELLGTSRSYRLEKE